MRNRSVLIDPKAFIGQTIRNRYYIQRLIGQGGMGHVYLARDTMSGYACAIKMFLPQKAAELSAETYRVFLERFKREYHLMDTLRHSHVIQVYDRGEYQGVAYFVMEYFENGSLADKIENTGKLSLQEAYSYIKQAASALDYIHARGIIHRDIKPQNMLINNQGQLILADFGVAHIVSSVLTLTEQPGTRVYKSPQAKLDWLPDRRDDIYSLGVVLYEMLTGNEPHIRYIRNMGSEVPPEIVPIILKAMAEPREQRYSSAQEMAGELEEAVSRRQLSRRLPYNQARGPSPRQHAFARNQPGKAKQRGPFFSLLTFGIPILVAILALSLLMQKVTAHPSTIIFSFPSATAVTKPPTTSSMKQATAVVEEYYTDWNKQNYRAAYNLLQTAYQQRNPFSALLSAYQHTHHVCMTITSTTMQADNSVQVGVTANAIEDTSTGGTIISPYYVVYDVRQEQQRWKLAPTSLRRSSEPGICGS